jgi:hypothetical protein
MRRISDLLVNDHGFVHAVEAREANEAIRSAVRDAQERLARACEDAGSQLKPAVTVPVVVARLVALIRAA